MIFFDDLKCYSLIIFDRLFIGLLNVSSSFNQKTQKKVEPNFLYIKPLSEHSTIDFIKVYKNSNTNKNAH